MLFAITHAHKVSECTTYSTMKGTKQNSVLLSENLCQKTPIKCFWKGLFETKSWLDFNQYFPHMQYYLHLFYHHMYQCHINAEHTHMYTH